jgi:RNA polymerase sigma-70 factor (ECF subfamily)
MSPDENDRRLEHITTNWSVIRDAHGTPDTARAALEALTRRYGLAIERYLRKVAGGAESAAELYQEFWVSVAGGKLKSADPGRGRFRDYVKAVLRHLVARYHAKRKRGPQAVGGDGPALDAVPAPEPEDGRLDEEWRETLLARTWAALRTANAFYYEVLWFRAHHADLRSPELAARLTARLGKALTAEGVRQTLHRARRQFCWLLLEEVKDSLANPTREEAEEELAELGLLQECRDALDDARK